MLQSIAVLFGASERMTHQQAFFLKTSTNVKTSTSSPGKDMNE